MPPMASPGRVKLGTSRTSTFAVVHVEGLGVAAVSRRGSHPGRSTAPPSAWSCWPSPCRRWPTGLNRLAFRPSLPSTLSTFSATFPESVVTTAGKSVAEGEQDVVHGFLSIRETIAAPQDFQPSRPRAIQYLDRDARERELSALTPPGNPSAWGPRSTSPVRPAVALSAPTALYPLPLAPSLPCGRAALEPPAAGIAHQGTRATATARAVPTCYVAATALRTNRAASTGNSAPLHHSAKNCANDSPLVEW